MFVIEVDINNALLLKSLFEVVQITHVMHLAAQVGAHNPIENPGSYVHSNIAGLVNIFEICKAANPQPAIVWASLSSVYGLDTNVLCFVHAVLDKSALHHENSQALSVEEMTLMKQWDIAHLRCFMSENSTKLFLATLPQGAFLGDGPN
jgi:nucleoside-diphosphate-sugar epimerase